MRISPKQSMKLLKSQKTGGLIGGLMLIMGVGAFVHVAKITLDTRSIKNWVPHTAQVERAGLTTHVNDRGGKTYSLEVAYIFDWEGTPYKGRQYRLHDKPNPDFEESRDILEDLLRSRQDGGEYPIFVNPKNPLKSAVVNTVHPKARTSSLFLGFLFSIIGYFTAFKPKLFGKRSKP